MGKYDPQNSKEKMTNTKKKKGVNKGRPPKIGLIDILYGIQSLDQKQQEYWFTDDERREIVRILASKCQILFKCLSGQPAAILKTKFSKNKEIKVGFEEFKRKRQAFEEEATQLQTELLKKLEQYLQIKLIGEKKQMKYFFFGNNSNTKDTQDQTLNLLRPIIHEDFFDTLKELLELTKQSQSQESQQFLDQLVSSSLSNIYKHKHFVCWAFIRVWGKKIRNHLARLQQTLQNEYNSSQQQEQKNEYNSSQQQEQNSQQKDTFESLIKESDEILKVKKHQVLGNIDVLFQKYHDQNENEMNELVILLEQRSGNEIQ